MGNQQNENAYKEYQINSYKELMAAVSDATSDSVKFVAEEKGAMIMRLSSGFKVVVYEDNHTVNLEFKYGNINKMFYCFNYQEAFQTILNADNGNIKFANPVQMSSAGKIFTRVIGVITFILGITLLAVAGFILLGLVYGAIYESFSPIYKYLALFITFEVALFGASALMYLGLKLVKRKIYDKIDEEIER